MQLEKRIHTVWYLTLVTIVLMIGVQAYWLYNQYRYQQMENAHTLFDKCAQIIRQEEAIRGERNKIKKQETENFYSSSSSYSFNVKLNLSFSPKRGKNSTSFQIDLFKREGVKKVLMNSYAVTGLSSDAILPLTQRYMISSERQFNTMVVDSLLRAKQLPSATDFNFHRSKKLALDPTYRIEGGMAPFLCVTYPFDPLRYQSVSFKIPMPVSSILKSMMWQLGCSFILTVILVICLIYQLKTILIQKRIDGIRRTFLKNMIYEMKQPKTEESTDEDFILIGKSRFYYQLNELRCGSERIIITSRQSDILQILSSSLGHLVMRNEILNKVWGDDSYSNSLALNVQITYLRRAFRSDSNVVIEAVMKKGYLLRVVSASDSVASDGA